ncbi:hypothetical protein GG681_06060 [Epibacterium sp. SM1969]|uniref:DUF6473 domain-containing protein n=1 Tax=Tritonibacter aquimaris TaxID=2663379 RepID=A0A844ASG7_9RHOB|nr:DUF6473 family protein [Tritonibacter aquimaris]MQY42198.1 hypothetical protein [Tritonibacter aquimaris]
MSNAKGSAAMQRAETCHFGDSKLSVRGPVRELDQPYMAFLGSTEVYGRFIDTPFPEDVETLLQMPCVNFAAINGGLDSYIFDPTLREMAAGADIAVVQVMGAQNLSNEFYKVHPRRNDRFLMAHDALLDLYPDVDFTEFHFNRHMLNHLEELSSSRFLQVKEHVQSVWVARMQALIADLHGDTVLLWLQYSAKQPAGLVQEPVWVDRSMVDALRSNVADVFELQLATAQEADDFAGMAIGKSDLAAARVTIGPREQHRIACALATRILQVLE